MGCHAVEEILGNSTIFLEIVIRRKTTLAIHMINTPCTNFRDIQSLGCRLSHVLVACQQHHQPVLFRLPHVMAHGEARQIGVWIHGGVHVGDLGNRGEQGDIKHVASWGIVE